MRVTSEKVVRALVCVCVLLFVCAIVLASVGCQTRVTIEKNPQQALPIYKVIDVNGTPTPTIVDYMMLSGGWTFTARSPLFAKEQFRGFHASVSSNGVFTASIDTYDRDLSTNAVVMTKTIFDGSANLALAVARAYATISTGGASDAIVSRVVSFFKSKGGDASKSTVTSDGKIIKVSDGSTCISCDAAGNCSECTP